VTQFCQSKISNFRTEAFIKKDVVGLNIKMDDAGAAALM
jgi:hypothetical protein